MGLDLVEGLLLMIKEGKSLDREDIDIMDGLENYQVSLPVTFWNMRSLLGVKELLEAAQPLPSTKKQRSELRKNVDADYYGYRDEDDGLLLEYEEAQEEIAMGHTMKDQTGEPEEGWTPIGDVSGIPRQAEVEKWLVERRKRRLMERYGM
jgi:pre-mRNA-splicing factor ISY1